MARRVGGLGRLGVLPDRDGMPGRLDQEDRRRPLALVGRADASGSADGLGPSSGRPRRPPRRSGARASPPVDGPNLSDPDVLLARAEASYRAGLDARRASKDVAARYQVDALADASAALAGLLAEPGGRADDPRTPEARVLLDAAQEEFLRVTSGRRVRLDEDWRAGLAEKGIRLTIARDADSSRPSGSTSSSSPTTTPSRTSTTSTRPRASASR